MEFLQYVIDIFLHLDTYLSDLVSQYGVMTYALLFIVIFAETGFVVTPFLPGDSLLFAAGTIASLGSLHIGLVIGILIAAAVLGDTVNYWIGHFLGQKIIDNPKIRFINQEHIDKTEQFFKKYGGKTIILARFVPIVRTFAPFVAGIGCMNYQKFIVFNIIGGCLWVGAFTFLGFLFGNIPFVQKNFHYAVFGIIFLSIIPIIYEFIQSKKHPNVAGLPRSKLKHVVNKE